MKFRMIHENYNVADLDASIRFYEEALGLHEARRKTGEDFIIVFMSNEESDFELELTWLADHPQKYDIGEEEFHLAFRTDDIDAAHAQHEKCGAAGEFLQRVDAVLELVGDFLKTDDGPGHQLRKH